MSELNRLTEYLTQRGISFTEHEHSPAATAQETAAAEHVSGKRFAKTVVVRHGEDRLLAVVPAHHQVDLERLARLSGKGPLELDVEASFSQLFPDCEMGAIPPFGRLWGLETWIDDALAEAPEITFDACSHSRSVTLSGRDFLAAAEGRRGHFSHPAV